MNIYTLLGLFVGIIIGITGSFAVLLACRSKAERLLGIVATVSRRDEPHTIEDHSAVTSYVFKQLELESQLKKFRFRLEDSGLERLVNYLAQNWTDEIVFQYPWYKELLEILTGKVGDVSAEKAIDLLLENHGIYSNSSLNRMRQWHRRYLDELTKKDLDKEILWSFFQECWELESRSGAECRIIAGILARKTELFSISELLKLYKALDANSSHTRNKRRVAKAIARRKWVVELDRDNFREVAKIVVSVFEDEESCKSSLADNLATAEPKRLTWLLGDVAAFAQNKTSRESELLMSMVLDELSNSNLPEELEKNLYMIAVSYSENIGSEIIAKIIEVGWTWPEAQS